MTHSDDDQQLWQAAMHNVTPLHQRAPAQKKTSARQPIALTPQKRAPQNHSAPPQQVLIMDDMRALSREQKRHLKRRSVSFDRTIDLHGYSLDEAQRKVVEAIVRRRDERWLLFITGQGKKGGASDAFRGRGKIRQSFPQWMQRQNIKGHLLAFGSYGEGAYYVYVRR